MCLLVSTTTCSFQTGSCPDLPTHVESNPFHPSFSSPSPVIMAQWQTTEGNTASGEHSYKSTTPNSPSPFSPASRHYTIKQQSVRNHKLGTSPVLCNTLEMTTSFVLTPFSASLHRSHASLISLVICGPPTGTVCKHGVDCLFQTSARATSATCLSFFFSHSAAEDALELGPGVPHAESSPVSFSPYSINHLACFAGAEP